MSWLALTPEEWSALLLSAKVAAVAVAVVLVPGVFLGWLLARKRFPGKMLVESLVYVPLVIPPVVTGYVLLTLFGANRPLGRWLHEGLGIEIAFTWKAAAIAAGVMGFPLLVRAVRLSVESRDAGLEQAALMLGSPPWRTWLLVTLPLALPGVVTGALLCFARALGEFGATITFAGNIQDETRTLPLAIFSAMQRPGGDAIALRLVIISFILSLGALIASELIARRLHGRFGLARA